MTSINALTAGGTTGTAGTSGTAATSTEIGRADQFGKDTFLKLLVAQLQYQDPTNPADTTAFLSQTAQFTLVEKLESLSDLERQVLSATQSQSAASLVGRTVTWVDEADVSHTGTVTAAQLGSSPTLTVDGNTVDLSAVTSVKAATTA